MKTFISLLVFMMIAVFIVISFQHYIEQGRIEFFLLGLFALCVDILFAYIAFEEKKGVN